MKPRNILIAMVVLMAVGAAVRWSAWLVRIDEVLRLTNGLAYPVDARRSASSAVRQTYDVVNQLCESKARALWNVRMDKRGLLPELDLNLRIARDKLRRCGAVPFTADFLLSRGKEREKRAFPVFLGAAVSPSPSESGTSNASTKEAHSGSRWIKWHWDWWGFLFGLVGGVCGSILTIALMRPNDKSSPTCAEPGVGRNPKDQ